MGQLSPPSSGPSGAPSSWVDFGRSPVKDDYMTSETSSAAKSGQESVVLASFDSYRQAEHMLASFGRGSARAARLLSWSGATPTGR
jgi:hypothetical protein